MSVGGPPPSEVTLGSIKGNAIKYPPKIVPTKSKLLYNPHFPVNGASSTNGDEEVRREIALSAMSTLIRSSFHNDSCKFPYILKGDLNFVRKGKRDQNSGRERYTHCDCGQCSPCTW